MSDAYILRIFGRVQGVAFRYRTYIQARTIGIQGWVRNMPDGSVEVFCEGDKAKLGTFIKWAEKGPPSASVSHVKKIRTASKGCTSFTIEY